MMRSLLAIAPIVLLFGCSTGGDAVDGPLMRHPSPSDDGASLEAEVRGVLELTSGCLYLTAEEAGEPYQVLWPAGTRWDAERQVVMLPSGDEVAVGEFATGGGGYFSADEIERIAGSEVATLARQCATGTSQSVAVVNNNDAAIAPG